MVWKHRSLTKKEKSSQLNILLLKFLRETKYTLGKTFSMCDVNNRVTFYKWIIKRKYDIVI